MRAGQPAVVSSIVFLSLNVPGVDKCLSGTENLFSALRAAIAAAFPEGAELECRVDALGPYALYLIAQPASEVKRCCVAIETTTPAYRLADLDVYAPDGRQIGRREIGLSSRSCLLCPQPAVDCMRQKTHAFEALVARVHELLTPYRT